MPWRSRARGGAARAFPAAGAGVDGAAVRLAACPSKSKAKIAHTLRGSALAVGAGRVASAAWRIEELASARRRPGFGGGARHRRAPIRSRRGRSPKSTAFERLMQAEDRVDRRRRHPPFGLGRAMPGADRAREICANALSAPPRLLYVGALCIGGARRANSRLRGVTRYSKESFCSMAEDHLH